MTRPAFPDELGYLEKLVRRTSAGLSPLGHRGGAGELDWLLLRGATAGELEEVRGAWREHIVHLRDHRLEIDQSDEFYRIAGVLDAPAEGRAAPEALDATGSPEESTEDEDPDSEDPGLGVTPRNPAPPGPNEVGAAGQVDPERLLLSARSLAALAGAGVLTAPANKDSVGMLIRRATECNKWHNSAHFRSRQAAALIAQANIGSEAQYQAFCRKNLRHEHMVPVGVLYQIITSQAMPTEAFIADRFRLLGKRATITKEQDALLNQAHRSRMPPDFWRPGTSLYMNPLARYIAVGIADDLEVLNGERWFSDPDR